MIVLETAKAQATGPALPAAQILHLAGRVHALRHRHRTRLAGCRKKCSTDAVHALRIEIRRLLALLELLDALNIKGSLNKLRRAFKKHLNRFDTLRDMQVQLRLLKPMTLDFPEAGRLVEMLRRDESRMASDLGRSIKATKFTHLNRRLKKLEKILNAEAKVPPKSARSTGVLPALGRAFHRVILLRRRVRSNNPESIHRMRVAFKQFRYLSELLQPFLPWLTDERRERMKEYQSAAGEVQDLEVLLGRLATVAEEGRMSKAAIRHLRRELCRRKRRASTSFLARIDDVKEFQPRSARPVWGGIRTVRK
jgi:CHAD domain-containing protein